MSIFGREQGDDELSTVSISQLNKLLQTLEATADAPEQLRTRSDLTLALTRKHLSPCCNPHPSLLVVNSEDKCTAKRLVIAIRKELQRIAISQDQSYPQNHLGENVNRQRYPNNQKWIFGAVIYRLEQRPILRGAVELRMTEPIFENIPDDLLQYLVTVPGMRDQLIRETHGYWGFHYHYIDHKKRRSDTLLTFDHKDSSAPSPALCWERHAERNSTFKARAETWGVGKRESVYSACLPDTDRFKLSDFKRPASDAKLVWPLTR